MVGKRVFRVRKDIYHNMPDIGDRIYLNHFPHTNALVRWQHLDTPPPRETTISTSNSHRNVSHNPPHTEPS